MMMVKESIHILYVEDDTNLGFVVQDRLKREGFQVHLCRDGKSALQQFHSRAYDCCVLDVMLPEKDGFGLAEDIRRTDQEVPILFLTARGQMEDKTKGYGLGGDDYLTKPFEHQELVLRIHALLKRSRTMSSESTPEVFQMGACSFRPDSRELEGPTGSQRLTKTEGKVLEMLCKNSGKVIERDLILNSVWGKDDYHTGRSLDVYISKLRKYLSQDPALRIDNIHGTGFQLIAGS